MAAPMELVVRRRDVARCARQFRQQSAVRTMRISWPQVHPASTYTEHTTDGRTVI